MLHPLQLAIDDRGPSVRCDFHASRRQLSILFDASVKQRKFNTTHVKRTPTQQQSQSPLTV
ncbi:MAG TPA: hypothetical protein VGK44_01850, partial [Casimicrobiaceae bacterium]